ncbi:hypothetical protein FQN49_006641 [Arthroderma sp. PD_2]|nr:hypothetical protein FQN49_006641 [Arthroderma sp. PD_2]
MAPNKEESAAFEAIIHSARLRRQKQALTDEFFGRGRKSSAPGSNASSRRGSPAAGSLASRVEKRVAPGGVKKQQAKPSHVRQTRESRMLSGFLPTNTKTTRAQEQQPGLNIKGRASGPCLVIGSNFAPGTTAEDIESAFSSTGGDILQCRLTKTFPSVTAQLVFAERQGAEGVVAAFNSQKADGRIIQVRIEPGVVPSFGSSQSNAAASFPGNTKSAFDSSRELADKERRESRRPADVQDGRFGFEDPVQHSRQQQQPDLYDQDARNSNRNQTWRGNRRRNPQQHNGAKPDLYSDTMMVDQQPSTRQTNNRRRH